jgi:hypothetical protein
MYGNTLQFCSFYEIQFSICYWDVANSMFFDSELQLLENAAMRPGTPFRILFAQLGA